MKTVLFVGADATERGLLEYARTKAETALNLIFTRTAEESIAYLNGERVFADRQRYPLPGLIVVDLVNPRLDKWDLTDWIKARPDLSEIPLCFIGGEEDKATLSKARSHGRCFFTKPGDAQSYIDLIQQIAADLNVASSHERH